MINLYAQIWVGDNQNWRLIFFFFNVDEECEKSTNAEIAVSGLFFTYYTILSNYFGYIYIIGICTASIYLSCKVLLIFLLKIPMYAPEPAIFLALIDYIHYLSSAIMKIS